MPILLRTFNTRPTASSSARPGSQASDHLRSTAPTSPPSRSGSASIPSVPSRLPSQDDVFETASGSGGIDLDGHVPLPPPKETLSKKIKGVYKRLRLQNLLPLAAVLVYMFLGAVLFLWLEGGEEAPPPDASPTPPQFTEAQVEQRKLFLRRLEEIVEDRAPRRRSARRELIREALQHYEISSSAANDDSAGNPWTLMSAMYYAGTLFTTIGYGDMACVTSAGRALTVAYSCIGIPLMLITLNDLGKFLYSHINESVSAAKGLFGTLGVLRPFSIISRRTRPSTTAHDDNDVEAAAHQAHDADSAQSQFSSLPSVASLEADGSKVPRMGVVTALVITIGWIFFCAALFQLWEDWTYAESCYFMFISLSTIGLGDVNVARKDLMVVCFVFVIVGLSLVSMCISVVQAAIEDFYINLMLALLKEYQEKMTQGDGEMGASVGMMRMFGNKRTAKFLMPLLSKEKKRCAMEKVEVAAKDAGLDFPPILADLDEKTGMPKLLSIKTDIKKDSTDEAIANPELEKLLLKQQMISEDAAPPPAHLIQHSTAVQTDTVLLEEKNEQTEAPAVEDSFMQTELRLDEMEERTTQTDTVIQSESSQQTERVTVSDAATSTASAASSESSSQTETVQTVEQEVQSYLAESVDGETQTTIETKNVRLQTPIATIVEIDIQTEHLVEDRKKKRRLRIFRRSEAERRNSEGDALIKDGEGEETLEDEGSVESLHWDPVDGLHAEKQLPVHRLQALFDPAKRSNSTEGSQTTGRAGSKKSL